MNRSEGDPYLKWAKALVGALILLPAVLLLLIATDGVVRASRQDRAAVQWMQRLDLCVPALWPSGTPQRHPQALPAGMDLRWTPLSGGRPPVSPFPETESGVHQP